MNIDQIKSELGRLNIRPNKLKGQNFLVDEDVLDTIIKSANIKKGETIVEIGPGLGALTSKLLSAGANVIAIEQEREFGEYLRKKFKGYPLDVIIANAVLKIPELVLPKNYKVVSNLPYSITSPVINLFLTHGCHCEESQQGDTAISKNNRDCFSASSADRNDRCCPQKMALMVQKEVARRLVAKSGESERGVLTVVVELLSNKRNIITTVSPSSFYPAPKVDSAILEILLSPTHLPKNFEGIMSVVKTGFSKKRAKLKNALKPKYGDTTSLLQSAGIDESFRAEDVTPDQWIKLSDSIYKN